MGLYEYGKKNRYANMYGASHTWFQKLAIYYYLAWVEVPKDSWLDDDIDEALSDMYSDGEGYRSPYYLRYHLKKRRLLVISWHALFAGGLCCFALGTATILIALVAR